MRRSRLCVGEAMIGLHRVKSVLLNGQLTGKEKPQVSQGEKQGEHILEQDNYYMQCHSASTDSYQFDPCAPSSPTCAQLSYMSLSVQCPPQQCSSLICAQWETLATLQSHYCIIFTISAGGGIRHSDVTIV